MSEFTRTDVTAVKLYDGYVLAGIGSSLYVYKKNTAQPFEIHCKVLEQKIHDIVPAHDESTSLIFGGKEFKVLRRSHSEFQLFHVPDLVTRCDDWIHCGMWITVNKIAILTAHNVIQFWDVSEKPILTSAISKKDNSILYCGLLVPLNEDVLVFSGTVFSEVIISRCNREQPLQRLTGHKGVIFSISCSLQRGIIVTTSDDRSVRIWDLKGPTENRDTIDYWDDVTISCIHELYGHSARVMRSCITSDHIVSVGEDSGICFWNIDGHLLRKITAHQNAPIWSVDADDNHLVTGGGDGSVTLHPLSVATDYSHSEMLKISSGTPKKLVFTARGNVVVLNETGDLIYYDAAEKSEVVHRLKLESTYVMLSISSCKQIIAIADMIGNLEVFIENCKGPATMNNVISTKLVINKILSMHWAGNRHLVLCSESGEIYIVASRNNKPEIVFKFSLPHCKERWLTAAAMSCDSDSLVVGDRCGNIHFYAKDAKNPIKTFAKVHGRYGPTSITIKTFEVITTGRDGTVKYFSIDLHNGMHQIKLVSSKDVGFQWVEKIIDSKTSFICGFQERAFVMSNIRNNSKLLEWNCGGGHRSWDVVRYVEKLDNDYEEFIKLIYVKNSDINVTTFQLSKITSTEIIKGTHSKEINCLKSYRTRLHKPLTFFISGGEDTTLRISRAKNLHFQDEVIVKHLSSVRSLKTYLLDNGKLLVVSGGGRAQISIKAIDFRKENDETNVLVEDLVDHMVKGTDKERKGDKTWLNYSVDFDPETRIMDLEIVMNDDNDFWIYAGCSDAYIRTFLFKYNEQTTIFKPLSQLKYNKTCILKTHCLQFNRLTIMITCTTRGELSFWDATELASNSGDPFLNTTTNKSGVSCISSKIISKTELMIATGGDDNAIHTILLDIRDEDLKTARVVHRWSSDKYHSSQITGILIVNNVLITASIDQRITMFLIRPHLDLEYYYQTICDIPDIQGIDLIEMKKCGQISVCVFGKGLQVLTLRAINDPDIVW